MQNPAHLSLSLRDQPQTGRPSQQRWLDGTGRRGWFPALGALSHAGWRCARAAAAVFGYDRQAASPGKGDLPAVPRHGLRLWSGRGQWAASWALPIAGAAIVALGFATAARAQTANPFAPQLGWEETARILAGSAQIRPEDEAAALHARHGRRIDRSWKRWDAGFGQPLANWAKAELAMMSAESDGHATVFYPFSGPDFVTVHRLWPTAGRYVLVAGQNAGVLPDVARVKPKTLSAWLEALQREVARFSWNGYFRTSNLNDTEASDEGLRGVTAILLFFAVREGYSVLDVYPIRLAPSGLDIERLDPGRKRNWDSVRVVLREPVAGRQVLLDYLSLGLSDPQLASVVGAKTWIRAMSAHPTVLKAASHLLQTGQFEVLATALLERAPLVVQDETGLAWTRLRRAFQVQLFGRYTQPIGSFEAHAQDELAKAYRQARQVRALKIRFGYQKAAGSCVQVAKRVAAGPARN
jgi:hypothetical protein